jgi:hypothetical protein
MDAENKQSTYGRSQILIERLVLFDFKNVEEDNYEYNKH